MCYLNHNYLESFTYWFDSWLWDVIGLELKCDQRFTPVLVVLCVVTATVCLMQTVYIVQRAHLRAPRRRGIM